jgi:hypothetical protein
MCYIINNFKTNKVAGSDIPPEIIKKRGRTPTKTLNKLSLNVWDNSRSVE